MLIGSVGRLVGAGGAGGGADDAAADAAALAQPQQPHPFARRRLGGRHDEHALQGALPQGRTRP